MPNPITQAQPPLEFIQPAFDPLVLRVGRSLLPLWSRWRAQVTDVEVKNGETLVDLYQQFQSGKIRFLLAFRHPSATDPLCMAHLLWQQVPQIARQQDIQLQPPTHAHFIYDRGIPLWAGEFVGWLYSHLGGIPIRRGKVDLQALRSIRQLFANGRFPIAAAPEGATNGHNGIVSPIEPGIAQFGFWCVEDLLKADRSEAVLIVPVGIQYQFVEAPWKALVELLTQLEADSGLSSSPAIQADANQFDLATLQDGATLTDEQAAELYSRLLRLGEHLLSLMEQFYAKFYHQTLTSPVESPVAEASNSPVNEQVAIRLQSLLNAALQIAEQHFELAPKGTLTDRCRRLEQAGWDWIYREDLKQIERLSPVERGLADRIAEEANLRIWHMRLVETFVSVTGRYVAEKPTVERFAEMALLLWDTVARLKGRNPFPRPQLGQQRAQLAIGQPLSVSDRWASYQTSRRQAVASLTQDLQTALEEMILSA